MVELHCLGLRSVAGILKNGYHLCSSFKRSCSLDCAPSTFLYSSGTGLEHRAARWRKRSAREFCCDCMSTLVRESCRHLNEFVSLGMVNDYLQWVYMRSGENVFSRPARTCLGGCGKPREGFRKAFWDKFPVSWGLPDVLNEQGMLVLPHLDASTQNNHTVIQAAPRFWALFDTKKRLKIRSKWLHEVL